MERKNDFSKWGALSEELFDVVDAQGNPTGQTKARSAVHRDGDWHRAINVWVINPDHEILFQRRAADKDSYPGLLDVSCGGHIVAGEDSITTAIRELKEELNLDATPSELTYLDTDRTATRPAPDFINNSFNDLYLLHTQKTLDELHPQPEEVSELIFLSPQELRTRLAQHPEDFVPHTSWYQAILDIVEGRKP